MARISGVDLPKNKRVEIAFTYLFGIGKTRSIALCKSLGFNVQMRSEELTDADIAKVREYIEKNFKIEGDLRRDVSQQIKRLIDLGAYRGIRHKRGLPVRGQRTRSNSRTRKGPRKTVANKKKVV